MVIPKPTSEPWSQCNTCSKRVVDAAARSCPRKYCDARTVLLKCDKVETRKRQDEERKKAQSPSYVDPYKAGAWPGADVYVLSHDENGA